MDLACRGMYWLMNILAILVPFASWFVSILVCAQLLFMKRKKPFWSSGGGKHQRFARAVALGGLIGQTVGDQARGSGEVVVPYTQKGPLDGDPEVDTLLELWALGLLSAVVLQVIADAACKVAPRPPMQALANIGTKGDHKNNAHRDLTKKINQGRLDELISRPMYVDLPLLEVRRNRRLQGPRNITMQYPILLPHVLMHDLFHNYNGTFAKSVLGDGDMAGFWQQIPANDARLVGHPVNRIDNEDRKKVIPLRLHGDGVPIGKGKKRTFEIISWSSMLGHAGPTWDTRFFAFGVINEVKDTTTMPLVWRILLWSFAALLRNRWPLLDWDGVPFSETHYPEFASKAGDTICGDYKFVLWQVSADLDYLCNYLQLRHFGKDTPCFRCNCNRTSVPWSALVPDAAWRNNLVSLLEWRTTPKHILFQQPNIGLNLFHVCLDVLHILDLGVVQYICGSIISLFLHNAGLEGSFEVKLEKVWAVIECSYNALGTSAGERLPHAVFAATFGGRRGYITKEPVWLHSKGLWQGIVCLH